MVDCHFSNPRKIKRILNHYLFFLNLYEKNLEIEYLPNIIRFIILAEYYPNIFELFLENVEIARKQLRIIGTPDFNVKAFEEQFGVQISGKANQLGQMKSLFELTGPAEILSKNARDVFSIVRSSYV